MNYLKMTYPDLNNGTGCRVSLWLTGCKFHCKGCFNAELWDFNSGLPIDFEVINELLNIIELPYITGLSILGGEPMHQNLKELISLAGIVKATYPEKDIWLYTGYTLQELVDKGLSEIFKYVDVIVDGQFIESESELNLKFRGSKNQHIWKKSGNIWNIVE